MTAVTIDQLRSAANRLLSHFENAGIKSVDITDDFYWDVPASERYDQYQEPTGHSVGQLSDDIAELGRVLDGSRPITGYGLVWLAAILRRIGETARI